MDWQTSRALPASDIGSYVRTIPHLSIAEGGDIRVSILSLHMWKVEVRFEDNVHVGTYYAPRVPGIGDQVRLWTSLQETTYHAVVRIYSRVGLEDRHVLLVTRSPSQEITDIEGTTRCIHVVHATHAVNAHLVYEVIETRFDDGVYIGGYVSPALPQVGENHYIRIAGAVTQRQVKSVEPLDSPESGCWVILERGSE